MQAVILCGGEGTRLRPLTYEIPKALIQIQGRTVTEHIFDLLKKFEIKDLILAVGYLREKIMNYFGDGKIFGVNITYIEEEKPLGTAGPLRLARDTKKLLNETFIVSNGDELKEINIKDMLNLHKKSNALATIALTPVKNPSAYGVARLQGNRILEFVEKPKSEEAPSNLINAGFYIMEPKVVDMISNGFAMLEKNIFPKLAADGTLFGFKFPGQWFDTGNLERLEKARKEWKGIG